jgi:hypothetical protein
MHSTEVLPQWKAFNVNTLDRSIYDYYHYGSPLTSIHSTEVFMTTTTMVGLQRQYTLPKYL